MAKQFTNQELADAVAQMKAERKAEKDSVQRAADWLENKLKLPVWVARVGMAEYCEPNSNFPVTWSVVVGPSQYDPLPGWLTNQLGDSNKWPFLGEVGITRGTLGCLLDLSKEPGFSSQDQFRVVIQEQDAHIGGY